LCVKVVQDGDDELIMGDGVFQLGELVDFIELHHLMTLKKIQIFTLPRIFLLMLMLRS
jgi:hypothetical protein